MLAVTVIVTASCLYLIGLRADRIHAGRAVTEPAAVAIRGAVAGSTTVPLYRGHSVGYWNWRYRQTSRELRRAQARTRGLMRTLLFRPSVTEAINLAGAVYGNGSWLWRVARCESGLSADPPHNNPSRGLFQFRPSTFAGTPFGSFSVFSPYASALAAGWMASRGRSSEWVCR